MFNFSVKGTLCRSENLQVFLSSHKNNMPKVSHYNTIYFLSYAHPRCTVYEMFVDKHTETIE